MNWDAIGAIAELMGALGVIASLLFVALQVRQNSKVVAANTFQAISSTSSDAAFRMAENPQLAVIIRKSITEPSGLNEEERTRAEVWMRGLFRNYENYYYQYTRGHLEVDIWNGYLEVILTGLSNEFGSAWWGTHQRAFGKQFVEFINKKLSSYESDGNPFMVLKD